MAEDETDSELAEIWNEANQDWWDEDDSEDESEDESEFSDEEFRYPGEGASPLGRPAYTLQQGEYEEEEALVPYNPAQVLSAESAEVEQRALDRAGNVIDYMTEQEQREAASLQRFMMAEDMSESYYNDAWNLFIEEDRTIMRGDSLPDTWVGFHNCPNHYHLWAFLESNGYSANEIMRLVILAGAMLSNSSSYTAHRGDIAIAQFVGGRIAWTRKNPYWRDQFSVGIPKASTPTDECPVCTVLPNKVTPWVCSHQLCEICAAEMLRRHQVCPICREAIPRPRPDVSIIESHQVFYRHREVARNEANRAYIRDRWDVLTTRSQRREALMLRNERRALRDAYYESREFSNE